MFQGYLVKAGGVAIPNEFIVKSTYKTTNTVIETDAYRDADVLLHRETADFPKAVVKFETVPLNKAKLSILRTILENAYFEKKERKLHLNYWDIETLSYKEADVYLPNTEYTLSMITKNDMLYEGVAMEFIEY